MSNKRAHLPDANTVSIEDEFEHPIATEPPTTTLSVQTTNLMPQQLDVFMRLQSAHRPSAGPSGFTSPISPRIAAGSQRPSDASIVSFSSVSSGIGTLTSSSDTGSIHSGRFQPPVIPPRNGAKSHSIAVETLQIPPPADDVRRWSTGRVNSSNESSNNNNGSSSNNGDNSTTGSILNRLASAYTIPTTVPPPTRYALPVNVPVSIAISKGELAKTISTTFMSPPILTTDYGQMLKFPMTGRRRQSFDAQATVVPVGYHPYMRRMSTLSNRSYRSSVTTPSPPQLTTVSRSDEQQQLKSPDQPGPSNRELSQDSPSSPQWGTKEERTCRQCRRVVNIRKPPSALLNHAKRHYAEKQFHCVVCNYSSSESAHVRNHMLTKHAELGRKHPNDMRDDYMQAMWIAIAVQCFPLMENVLRNFKFKHFPKKPFDS